jgi:hypothetical protein
MTTVVSTNWYNKSRNQAICEATGIMLSSYEVFQIGDNSFAAGEMKDGVLYASLYMRKTSEGLDYTLQDAIRDFESKCNACLSHPLGKGSQWAIEGLEACKAAREKYL